MGVVRSKLVNHPLQILAMGVISGLESCIIYLLSITISSHLGNPAIRQRHGGVQPEGGGPVEVVGVGLGREPQQVGGGLQLPEDVPLTGAPDTSHN